MRKRNQAKHRRMKKVKYGVIGLGWFGEMHCEALAAIPNVEIHALCTRTPERLAKLAKAFGGANAFTDFNEMLADPELDAVSIVTMWDQHRDPAIAALRANKHVLLEKPMASTLEECDAIIEQVEQSDRAFMVGHVCRFNPRYVAAKQEIEAGKIGKIVSMYARRNVPAAVTEDTLRKIGPIIG
ncbi:MAG: Gfo/Idh/MocA family oxidoreductase, partial [Opitutales bacterium]